ncbi:NAD-glutamate dehydrogenase [soil metagenome]
MAAHAELAQSRPPGVAAVRVWQPQWANGNTVIQAVNDDMAFLVDTVTMVLARRRVGIRVLVHPVIDRASHHHPTRESWIHLEADRSVEDQAGLEADLLAAFDDVRAAVSDWPAMHDRINEVAHRLRVDPPKLDADEVRRSADFLGWLADNHFTFLGARDYRLDGDRLAPVPASGLGILRGEAKPTRLSGAVLDKARERVALVLTKANSRSTVHRDAYLDYVGVKVYDDAGEIVGERRFLGLYASDAYTESLSRIPLLADKAAEVLRRSGLDPDSHDGKSLTATLETWPRDEMVQASVDELVRASTAANREHGRRRLHLTTRRDPYGRFVSVLVWMPRDNYTTAVRERFRSLLRDRLGAGEIEFTVAISDQTTARVTFIVHDPDPEATLDETDLARLLADSSRNWNDDFELALTKAGRNAAWGVPAAYTEDYPAQTGADDVVRLGDLDPDGIDLQLDVVAPDFARLKLFRVGGAVSLSTVLPILSSTGVEVVDERPYAFTGGPHGTGGHIYDFGLRYPRPVPTGAAQRLCEAIEAMWTGRCEVDAYNALVLAGGLTWQQVRLLRAYGAYLQQAGTSFGQETIATALVSWVDLARGLLEFFEARFDPASTREADPAAIRAGLDSVVSLDHDRILGSYLDLIQATVATNYFDPVHQGAGRSGRAIDRTGLALKIDSAGVRDLPAPRPWREVFVHAPHTEGIHLRFGPIARGGLRWSDRRDDFRTEVLGLVKAQMVKNAVIVPVGAKGGFVVKSGDPVTAYKTFINALLDVTSPEDPYFVVAADKGTATFSDIANAISIERGFWLGDAFASGGSVGYDHKAMGITARGAWVSVQRHFRERGLDCQTQDFTCVGVGDMSGDVFGNGMLLSEHIRLVAAFDHRHIFIDPDPDAAGSYAERRRLFDLPRSSWGDYDTTLISAGGGVFPRSAKSIAVTEPMRAALGLGAVDRLTPAEMMRAVLTAPVDLLWNGGIGTYVKASHETHAAAGDRANDSLRVDGRDLRCAVVGEGGNLGFTQAGRVEYALAGGRINTDAIDNSAGVDTSDHEVNIKILLDAAIADGALAAGSRGELLASMTDQVADLVLRDNLDQNLALANAAANGGSLLHVHAEQIAEFEAAGVFERAVEGLPDAEEIDRRMASGGALTGAEAAVLMSWTKIVLARELLGTDVPDDPYLDQDLIGYFPDRLQSEFAEQIRGHRLRREIIVTQIVNDVVNGAGTTFVKRLRDETGASAGDLTRANFVAREIFGSLPLRREIEALDHRVDASVQTQMRIQVRTLVERASRWLVTHRGRDQGSQEVVDEFAAAVQTLMGRLPELASGRVGRDIARRHERLVSASVPDALATRVAVLEPAYMLLGVVDAARSDSRDLVEATALHFELGERLGLPSMLDQIVALPRADRWQMMARAAIREDLHSVYTELSAAAHRAGGIAQWQKDRLADVERVVSMNPDADLAQLSVALRAVRHLMQRGPAA